MRDGIRLTGIALWVGGLALPLTGVLHAVLITGVILLGGLVWKGSMWVVRRPEVREFSVKIRARLSPILQVWRPQRISRRQRYVVGGTAVVGMALLPLGLNDYMIDVLTLAGIYVVLALGLNIVVGLAGLLDLGYIAFYALGAYTYALLSTTWGISFWVGLPAGGIVAGIFGVILGFVTLRLRGDYLAIVTLSFIQIIHLVLNNWDSVTNGPNGILNIARPSVGDFVLNSPLHFYYLILVIAVLTVFSVDRLNHSRIGRAWIAIREDEVAAEAMGVDTTRMKILAFALGAFWAGVAGVYFAGKFAFISPESFTFFETVIVLAMVVLGGMGSIPGVILGALIIVILPEVLRGFASYRMLIFGAALVLMMLFRPQGLIGNPRRRIELGGDHALAGDAQPL